MTRALIRTRTRSTIVLGAFKGRTKVTGATRVAMVATRVVLAATGASHFVARLSRVLVAAAALTCLIRIGPTSAKGIAALTSAPVRSSTSASAACFDVIGWGSVRTGNANACRAKLNIIQSIWQARVKFKLDIDQIVENTDKGNWLQFRRKMLLVNSIRKLLKLTLRLRIARR